MKIGKKIISGFMMIAFLAEIMGIIGVISSKQIGETFEYTTQVKMPELLALIQTKSAVRQASIKAIEYALRGNERDKKKTINIIKLESGTHFDPEVVKAFLSLHQKEKKEYITDG